MPFISIKAYKLKKQPDTAEYFKYLGSLISNFAGHTREIKSRIVMTKAAFKN